MMNSIPVTILTVRRPEIVFSFFVQCGRGF
jgi:hypothetical protein